MLRLSRFPPSGRWLRDSRFFYQHNPHKCDPRRGPARPCSPALFVVGTNPFSTSIGADRPPCRPPPRPSLSSSLPAQRRRRYHNRPACCAKEDGRRDIEPASFLNGGGRGGQNLLQTETENFLAQTKSGYNNDSGDKGDDDDVAVPSSSSSQQAAHLLEQWLTLSRDRQQVIDEKKQKSTQDDDGTTARRRYYARMVFLKWLDTARENDAEPLSQYFHRVLSISTAPDAYRLYVAYFHRQRQHSMTTLTPPAVTAAAICMVVERMALYQWTDDDDDASSIIQNDLKRLLVPPTNNINKMSNDVDKTIDDEEGSNRRRRRCRAAQNAFLYHVPNWEAEQILNYIETAIDQPDCYSYAALIRKLIAENKIDAACSIAAEQRQRVAVVSSSALSRKGTTTSAHHGHDGDDDVNENDDGATVCTNLCLWALARLPERIQEVEPMFRTLRSPNAYSYSALLHALSPAQGRNVILNHVDSDDDDDACHRLINAHAYGIVMTKFAKLPDEGETVEELLHHAARRLSTDELIVLKGIAITAWGDTNTYIAPDRATAIYMTIDTDNDPPPQPSIVALTTALLQAWVRSTRPDAAERCRTIFQTMINQRTATTTAFHLMLSAQSSDLAWEILQAQAQLLMGRTSDATAVNTSRTVMPVAASWATVLARPGHSVERIYEIVAHYKDAMMHKKRQRDDDAVFVQAVRAFPTAATAHAFVVNECRPVHQRRRNYPKVYKVLLQRWSRSRDAVAPERVEEIALWIAKEQEEANDSDDGATAEEVRQLLIETWHRSNRAIAPARIGYLERQQSLLQT